jgi:hypothetical protein
MEIPNVQGFTPEVSEPSQQQTRLFHSLTKTVSRTALSLSKEYLRDAAGKQARSPLAPSSWQATSRAVRNRKALSILLFY